MFLHIGENVIIRKKDIIAIIDKETINDSKDTNKFIQNMIENGYLYTKNNENIKTYIITCIKKRDSKNRQYAKEYRLYTSNISSTALSNR